MRARLVITAAVVALVSVVPTWFSLQPLLRRSTGDGWQAISRQLLVLDLAVVTFAVAVVLYFLIGRPLQRIARTVESLQHEAPPGDLLLHLDRALRRLSLDLAEERRVNQTQLHSLTESRDSLLRLQAELVANDRLATVGKLAAGVAHEVGNPLSGILGYLSVLRMRAPGNAELLDLVERIEAEVQRIDGIVRSLLELGRPSRGKATPLDLRPIVDSAVRLLSAGRDFQNVTISVELSPSVWARAEAGPLSQVLVNLLLNAAQAMQQRGQIWLRHQQHEGRVVLVVDDSGPGLPDAVRARLFEPFFTTKAAGQGTGLGLAVSRHLLSQFDAHIEATNRPEGGARFLISMPAP